MINLTIGGVPEHFNWPWHKLMAQGSLTREDVEIRWRDYPGGSGAMAAALDGGELDAGLLLTEGAVAAIAQGAGFGIASLYTESPLIWGIHVPATSPLQQVADLEGATYAISRYGSGSHLMCFVHAKDNGWSVANLKFSTVGSLEGAIEAFAAGKADVFFWEKYMTQPVVDAGRFRRIGEFVAPWPAFVVCVGADALARKGAAVASVLERVLGVAGRLTREPAAVDEIAQRYGLARASVEAWLGTTRWAKRVGIGIDSVATAADALRELGLIARDFDTRKLIAPLGD
jgi:ABC-type nitrate/sulfonate/bicarbonate transport system substrate-binding protein